MLGEEGLIDMEGTCEICGRHTEVKQSWVWVTSYGERKHVQRLMCLTCIRLEKAGKL